jgi:hypothetical protein
MSNQKIEQLKEYAKIIKDTPYALKTYLQTYDNTQKRFVPLELFPDQIQLLEDYEKYNENITRKYRQAGVTTVTAAWISKKLQTAKKDNPERVLIIANKKDTAVEMANKIRAFIEQWPDWVNVGFSPDKNSESRFRLNNGCEVKAVATSADALRGYTPTILIFDEAAYIEAGEDFWAASMASLSTGGKIILISTPNGFDPIYYGVYDQAIRGVNDFHITDLRWFKDPRYTKDLRWVKCSDIVHYMLNREQYDDDEIVMTDFEIENYKQYEEEGYKPLSSWFESMSKKFKFDRRKIAQELECDFLGSGDGVIPTEVQDNIVKNMLRDPKEKYMQGTFWQWKEPIQGHKYIMGVDVSRGDSEDFSSINIIDFDEREQVAEYIGKIPPDDLASIAYKWGVLYEAFIVVDITGGMGVATSRKLQELNYKNLYIDGINTKNIWEYNSKAMEKIPGINFNNKRTQIVAAFEEQLRKGFQVRSARLMNELNTFVYINGRPDHQKGQHDDLIMGISMAIYVAESSFSKLEKATEQAKVMIESWAIVNNEAVRKESHFDPVIPNQNISRDRNGLHNNAPSKDDYMTYGWLFGGMMK